MEKERSWVESLAWRKERHDMDDSDSPEHYRYKGPMPLIDSVTNDWRHEKASHDPHLHEHAQHELRFCDLDDEDSCPNTTVRLLENKRFRRMPLCFVALVAILVCAWVWHVQPRVVQEFENKEGFLSHRRNGTFGLARHGDFHGTFLKQLHPDLIPGGLADREGKRRLVFVGDIHGCKNEFSNLLTKLRFNPDTDHLIATGDVISKGPDSPGVLDELIRVKAESVRGNHEDRILEIAQTRRGSGLHTHAQSVTSQGHAKDRALLESLKAAHIQYLHDMPLVIHIPVLPQASSPTRQHKDHGTIASDIYVVHAGLVPHVPIRKQDPYFVMNMRSIDRLTHVPSALRQTKKGDSKPWTQIWNWYNERLFRGRSLKGFHIFTDAESAAQQADDQKSWLQRMGEAFTVLVKGGAEALGKSGKKPDVVVYGHDSKSGLQIMKWSKGLDSACASGGQLTAMVLDAAGRTEIVQVGCKGDRT